MRFSADKRVFLTWTLVALGVLLVDYAFFCGVWGDIGKLTDFRYGVDLGAVDAGEGK